MHKWVTRQTKEGNTLEWMWVKNTWAWVVVVFAFDPNDNLILLPLLFVV